MSVPPLATIKPPVPAKTLVAPVYDKVPPLATVKEPFWRVILLVDERVHVPFTVIVPVLPPPALITPFTLLSVPFRTIEVFVKVDLLATVPPPPTVPVMLTVEPAPAVMLPTDPVRFRVAPPLRTQVSIVSVVATL